MDSKDMSSALVAPEDVPAAPVSPRQATKKPPMTRSKSVREEDFNKTLLEQPRRTFSTVEELEHYLKANPTLLAHPDDVEHLVLEEFPPITGTPTMQDVDKSLFGTTAESPYQFTVGTYAERLGDGMEWHLEAIRRIVIFNDQPEEIFYRFESGVLVNERDVRCSEEAVKRHFGMRPFLWQQWALLSFEADLRFQQDHERDFMEIDYMRFANSRWNEWLQHPSNADFLQLYNSKSEHVQNKLKKFIFSPFALCVSILKDKEKWDFEESGASAYQYSSVLGSGFITCIVCAFLQIVVPLMILLYTTRVSTNFPYFTILPNSSSLDMERIWHTTWKDFCESPRALDAVLMNVVVYVVFLVRVIPVLAGSVYDTLGDSPSMRSRINSLRLQSWLQGDDTVFQKLGFRFDRFFNGAYVALTNCVMMFTLFLTNNTVDIILNALAVEFITGFDEEIAQQKWFDEGKRFLRAGVIESAIAAVVQLEHCHSPEEFCKLYDCSLEDYHAKVHGLLYDPKQALQDELAPEYMAVKDKIWFSSAIVARDTGRKAALWQFEEPASTFGLVDTLVKRTRPQALRGIFNRYQDYYTWSKWDSALFLPRLPSNKEDREVHEGKVTNFNPASMLHPYVRFAWAIVDSLAYVDGARVLRGVLRRGEYSLFPFMLIDSLFDWVSFMFIMFVFPCALAFYTFLIVGCQPIMYNTGAEDALLYSTDYNFGG